MKLKSHKEFIIELEQKQPKLYNSIEILTKYNGCHTKLLVKDAYGICNVTPNCLLLGSTPTIETSIDKTQYFINLIENSFPNFFKNYKVVSDYINNYTHMLIETNFSICKVLPLNLSKGQDINIRSAINKQEYCINQFKSIHNIDYDYSLVEYKNHNTKVKIICNNCKQIFKQEPNHHLSGFGCKKCNSITWSWSKWEKIGLKSKYFDSFKVYVIKCWNEDECFYKIGKTFTTIKHRFKTKKAMPYNYEIIDVQIGTAQYISKLETILHKLNTKHNYLPKIKFSGMTECFDKLFL